MALADGMSDKISTNKSLQSSVERYVLYDIVMVMGDDGSYDPAIINSAITKLKRIKDGKILVEYCGEEVFKNGDALTTAINTKNGEVGVDSEDFSRYCQERGVVYQSLCQVLSENVEPKNSYANSILRRASHIVDRCLAMSDKSGYLNAFSSIWYVLDSSRVVSKYELVHMGKELSLRLKDKKYDDNQLLEISEMSKDF